MLTTRNLKLELQRSAAPFVAGLATLAGLTVVCFRYRVNPTTVGLFFLIVIVVVSLRVSVVPAALVAIVAYLCLDYFFTAPLFTLGMNQALDFVAPLAYVATALVITSLISNVRQSEEERKAAEERLRASQAELAHVSRVLTMGELAASIAHEINQPLTAIVANGSACLRWLSGQEPDLEEARAAARRIVRDGHGASDIMKRIRAFLKKAEAKKGPVDINETIREVVALTQDQAAANSVVLRAKLADRLPPAFADRIQLQQVVLNLVLNGIDAVSQANNRNRQIDIVTGLTELNQLLVSIEDSGPGINPKDLEHIFDAFYSTKAEGLGMGLAISRSIVEDHGGELKATVTNGAGATFQFTLVPFEPEP